MIRLAALVWIGCAAGSDPDLRDATHPTGSPVSGGPVSVEGREERILCPAATPLGVSIFWPAKAVVPVPTVLVVVGAQPWNRYGDLPGQPWGHYRDIARFLAGRGVASVLFDKGGTGETGGPPPDIEGRVREVEGVVDCVRQRPEVGPLTLIGHSQGAWVVVAAAPKVKPVRLILLSPGGGIELPPEPPVTVIQPASEATPTLRPRLIPGVNHLLLPEPATPGTSHVAPAALVAIAEAMGLPAR